MVILYDSCFHALPYSQHNPNMNCTLHAPLSNPPPQSQYWNKWKFLKWNLWWHPKPLRGGANVHKMTILTINMYLLVCKILRVIVFWVLSWFKVLLPYVPNCTAKASSIMDYKTKLLFLHLLETIDVYIGLSFGHRNQYLRFFSGTITQNSTSYMFMIFQSSFCWFYVCVCVP